MFLGIGRFRNTMNRPRLELAFCSIESIANSNGRGKIRLYFKGYKKEIIILSNKDSVVLELLSPVLSCLFDTYSSQKCQR